jgi:putative ABC transport system ATP-binding protein
MADVIAATSRISVRYGETAALTDATITITAGERVALMGPSGCGKSTLLHCIAGVVTPDDGEVTFDGTRLDTLRESVRSDLRLRRMGVVFQFGDLVPELTLVENVMLPLMLTGSDRKHARASAMELLDQLGVAGVAAQRAGSVSGGQVQRAAVARSLVHRPSVVLADEPTGSLDSLSSESVLDAMVVLSREIGAALLVVTHDHVVASHLDRLVLMRDGSTGTVPADALAARA